MGVGSGEWGVERVLFILEVVEIVVGEVGE